MHDSTRVPFVTNAVKIFNVLLLFYPASYRKKYGNEVRLVFYEMYQEELQKKGRVSIEFWLFQVNDIAKSVIEQHIDEIRKKGVKIYLKQTLHINKYNVIGGILLFPIFTMTGLEIISRIVQGDLFHYNRPFYRLLSHSPLYWFPILFTWVILFPLLAIVVNLLPLLMDMRKRHVHILNVSFFKRHMFSLAILAIGALFFIAMQLHDFAPCFLIGLTKRGIGQIPSIISFCRGA